jgi:hypothetical protein
VFADERGSHDAACEILTEYTGVSRAPQETGASDSRRRGLTARQIDDPRHALFGAAGFVTRRHERVETVLPKRHHIEGRV